MSDQGQQTPPEQRTAEQQALLDSWPLLTAWTADSAAAAVLCPRGLVPAVLLFEVRQRGAGAGEAHPGSAPVLDRRARLDATKQALASAQLQNIVFLS